MVLGFLLCANKCDYCLGGRAGLIGLEVHLKYRIRNHQKIDYWGTYPTFKEHHVKETFNSRSHNAPLKPKNALFIV